MGQRKKATLGFLQLSNPCPVSVLISLAQDTSKKEHLSPASAFDQQQTTEPAATPTIQPWALAVLSGSGTSGCK